MTKSQCSFPGLTGNQLKLLALLSMTLDHIGVQLFPQATFLRIAGRIALPLFAYMIAEGCQYTRSRSRYLMSIAALGIVCQLVYFFAMGSLYQCILITFSLSICLIFLLDHARKKGNLLWLLVSFSALALAWFLSEGLPGLLPGTDYAIDYGFWGILLPVLIYVGKDRHQRLLFTAVGLLCLCLTSGGIQWFCLASLPLLALYNGTRGKRKMKYLFYIYYPTHLVVIYLLSFLIK